MKTRAKRKYTSSSSPREANLFPSKKRFSDISTESESDDKEEVVVIKTEIKEEKPESAQQPPDDDSEDDVMILEEILTEVSVLGVRVEKQEPDIIAIEDDGGEEAQDETSEAEDGEESPPKPARPSKEKSCREKDKETLPYLPASQIIPLKPDPTCAKALTLLRNQTQHVKLTMTPITYVFRKWASFYRAHAEKFTILECDLWTWTDLKEGSGSNLFLALKHAVNIVELRIGSNCSGPCTYVPPMSKSLKLRRLKSLKISHGGEMNYELALHQIFLASAGNLEIIEFEYSSSHQSALRAFMSTMNNVPREHLRSLKSLSLSEMENNVVTLSALDLEELANIEAENLQKLFLGFCLWDEAVEALQQVLNNFITLKTFTIQGCFVTMQRQHPAITIPIPIMPYLEFLSMGNSYRISSEFEIITERPKKRRKSVRVLTEGGNAAAPSTAEAEKPVRDREYFSIRLQFPRMPKLRELHLGHLFEIAELHFRSFPSLQIFLVSSPWHLTVRFPTLGRHSKCTKVTHIRFPNLLTDHTFVEKVTKYFPNIECCWFNRPSVKVLRAFSKQMLSKNKSKSKLKQLNLRLQFDFAASLDWALLDKPSKQKGTEMKDELKKIEQLKAYAHWEEYALVYGVEVPKVEELPVIENKAEFRGLGALCAQLGQRLRLNIQHIPRKLRVPRGNLKWDHDDCDYTDSLIGYRYQVYPFSDAAWKGASRSGSLITHGFKLSSTEPVVPVVPIAPVVPVTVTPFVPIAPWSPISPWLRAALEVPVAPGVLDDSVEPDDEEPKPIPVPVPQKPVKKAFMIAVDPSKTIGPKKEGLD